jgi:hypothetical protein
VKAWAWVILLCASSAQAFVRTRSSKGEGIPSYWPGSCVFLLTDSRGSQDMPIEQVTSIVKKSTDNWAGSCSYLTFTHDAPAEQEAKYDGVNVVRFRRDRWSPGGDAGKMAYSPVAAAITSVFMINDNDPKDGLILDADIELNEINFTFANITDVTNLPMARTNTTIADLENTLTHELGHLMGLSHTCRDQASFANDLDENGNVPPQCDALMSVSVADRTKITTATMYNFADAGEIKKRTPTADDLAGICNAYPPDNLGGKVCERTDLKKLTSRGGCDAAPGGSWAPWMLGLVGILCVTRRKSRNGAASRRLPG